MNLLSDPWLAVGAIVVVLFAFALHEMAHAYVAMAFGDPTPAEHGRRTLNPIRHLDPVGTIMLVVSMLVFGFPFGFAVTPVNDSKMRRPRLHGALTSLAGPVTNILLCAIAGLVLTYLVHRDDVPIGILNIVSVRESAPIEVQVAWFAVFINAFLAVFNLLPIPPLDGGRIVGSIMRPELAREWNKIGEYGVFIILGFVLVGQGTFSSFLLGLQHWLLVGVGVLIGNHDLANAFPR